MNELKIYHPPFFTTSLTQNPVFCTILPQFLKGLRHEDFAILGHFCTTIITKCLYSYTRRSCNTMRKTSTEFYQGELAIIIFWVIFEDIASKLEKIGTIFFKFQSISILPSVATDNRKQFQCRKIVFNNNARPIFLKFN